jgi:predicted nucleic acid-binding protein
MPVAKFLVDASAWVRYPCREVAARLDELGAAGVLATCGVVELQLLAAIEDVGTYTTVAQLRRHAFPVLEMAEADIRRARDVQALLAGGGQFGVPWAALLVAALAERYRMTVLHDSQWFDVVAGTTGQAMDWVMGP